MKVEIPLAKNVLASLGITAAGSAIDERIKKNKTKQKTKKNKKKHGSGRTTANEFFNNFK